MTKLQHIKQEPVLKFEQNEQNWLKSENSSPPNKLKMVIRKISARPNRQRVVFHSGN